MSVVIKGMGALQGALSSFAFDVDKVIDDTVRITAIKVQQGAIKAIRDPSFGTYVKRYTEGGTAYDHVASKPGDAPNTDTGRLVSSISVDHHRGDKVAFVGTNLDYGFFLETVQNRPWLEPAKQAELPNFEKNMKRAIKIQVDKAGK
jgi:hypothetical protein